MQVRNIFTSFILGYIKLESTALLQSAPVLLTYKYNYVQSFQFVWTMIVMQPDLYAHTCVTFL